MIKDNATLQQYNYFLASYDQFFNSLLIFLLQSKYLSQLSNNTMKNYNGLQNSGATCYLNSLIQTLFMTYEFRQNLYKFRHDPKKISETDSIPFQLQKLFVRLQISNNPCKTNGLQKSFGWNDNQAFQQHDVQQFCRKLFQAIQISYKDHQWLNTLYSAMTISYIDCGKHIRPKQQMYMDLSLPIRGRSSLQQCIKEYLRPEQIQGVQCEQCGERVNVKKGIKFFNFPKILTLQLNRFQLNYQTFQREKINDFLYYPQILNMSKFLLPHSQIKTTSIPEQLQKKATRQKKQQSARTADIYNNKLGQPSIAQKPKRKGSFDDDKNVQKVKFFDEQNREKRQNQEKQMSKQQVKAQSRDILANLKSQKAYFDQSMARIKQKQMKQIEQDMLFGTAMQMGGDIWKTGTIQKSQDIKVSALYSKFDTKFQHQQDGFEACKQYPDNTFALYAVLVHSGGAYGGHYFAYIFDGKDWYKYDDALVKKVSRHQMRKYGNFKQDVAQHGTNAYLLFYRDVTTFKQLDGLTVPQQIKQIIQKSTQNQVQTVNRKQQMLDRLNKNLIVKIFTNQNENETIVIEDRFQQTIGNLKTRLKSFSPQLKEINEQNWRLRRYNKQDDLMQQVYSQQLNNATLQALGMRQQVHMIVQIKQSHQHFQDYDPKKIILKLNFWRQGVCSLLEKHLSPVKLYIRDDITFAQLYTEICKRTQYQNPQIIKRNFSVGNPFCRYPLQEFKEKRLIEMRFFNGLNLYIQEPNEKNQPKKWKQEFQLQQYRCHFRYNNPKIGEDKNEDIYFDNRKTLGQLKAALSVKIGIPVDQFRIKRSKNAVAQLTTFKKKLSELRMVNNQYIYLEEGKSSKGSIIIRKALVMLNDDRIEFQMLQQFQVNIDSQTVTVADLKKRLSQKTGIEVSKIRIRQYKSYQFGEIFIDRQDLQRIKQKSIIWQQTQTQDERGVQIYTRVFDIINMEVGPLEQFFIDRDATYEELAFIIEQKLGIQSDRVLCFKSISPGIQKSYLLDCDWVQIKFIPKRIKEEPIFISNDGTFLVIKRSQNAYHPKPLKKVYQTGVSSHGGGGEASLQITVVKQSQIAQTQNEKSSQIVQSQQNVNRNLLQ